MSDTIAAIATGGGVSAIGIIRMSGDDAISTADKIFRTSSGISLTGAENRCLYLGRLIGAESSLIDVCLCTISRGPESYTGEDTVEFHCHGSPVVLSEALRALFSYGVRQALAGEFTKRAFLNGRMDLTQAEAVIDLIEAETPAAMQNAAGQLSGAVSLRLDPIYSALLDIMAHFHVVIDYPDEDIDIFEMRDYLSVLRDASDKLSYLLSTFDRGRVLLSGLATAIVGRPNTGKSSLLNALLGYNRAIVTDVPGTTRDTIEERITVGGLLLRLIDTAGLRTTKDSVEFLGVSRSLDAVARADLVFLVLDGSESLQHEDFDALHSIPPDKSLLTIVNKSDLPQVLHDGDLTEFGTLCRLSALTGDGLESLEKEIKRMFPVTGTPPTGEIITNLRQMDTIIRSYDCLIRAIDAVEMSVTPDAVLAEVEAALTAIGEITGKVMRDDIISRIFERFCVGK